MKIRNYIYLCITIILFNACKKDAVTKPVQFTSTTYQNLEPFNSLGEPDNLLKDTISDSMISFINNFLPDGENLPNRHPELFTSAAIPDIAITHPSDVFLTFVSGNADNSNSVAFYTYPTNQPPASAKDIKLITYVFPNAGKLTPLQAGDKMEIGNFDVGTSIGIVLMQNAWDTTTHTLNNNAVHFCSTDALNPEVDPKLKRHAVLINYAPDNRLIIGFEDRDRTSPLCDNDFNDVVLYWTVKPS
ncbi:MAG TPA: DUF4114 domain-containing protein [Hanamia sp.]|nr:DUF4114 domain-containing protein [Hanamia sp.]